MKKRKVRNLLLYAWYLLFSIIPILAFVVISAYWGLRMAAYINNL